VEYLDGLGILGPRTLLVHGVQLGVRDCERARDRQVAWAHCPKSNAKLGNGVAPLGLLLRTAPGAPEPRIGLGSDSVASNNTMDLFEEMRFTVLMQRAARRAIDPLTAREAVKMATLGGARALGIDDSTGTLDVGKCADMCVVALDGLHAVPAYDPYDALVYSARASDVVCTVIGGMVKYERVRAARADRRFLDVDLAPVRTRLRQAARKMQDWRPSG
jgi:5-methylthioadenosine/S-adenosylhomocysteine deaminase